MDRAKCMLWFNTATDLSGNLIIQPTKIPETKEEAILSIRALETYISDGQKPYLKVTDFEKYFATIANLLSSE